MASPRARSKPDPDYLFVYGTLRPSAGHEMNAVLEQHGDLVGRGKIPGILYDVGRYPGAVKSTGTRAFVRGDLYALRNPERALKVLDRYEGWDEKKPRSGEFKRSRVLVSLDGGKTVKAWIYLYNRSTNGLTRIRSGDYPTAGTRSSSSGARRRSRSS